MIHISKSSLHDTVSIAGGELATDLTGKRLQMWANPPPKGVLVPTIWFPLSKRQLCLWKFGKGARSFTPSGFIPHSANIASDQFGATPAGVNSSVGEQTARQYVSSITIFNHPLPPARGNASYERPKGQQASLHAFPSVYTLSSQEIHWKKWAKSCLSLVYSPNFHCPNPMRSQTLAQTCHTYSSEVQSWSQKLNSHIISTYF